MTFVTKVKKEMGREGEKEEDRNPGRLGNPPLLELAVLGWGRPHLLPLISLIL